MLNGHGNDIYKYHDIKADFSSNVIPYDYNQKLFTKLNSLKIDKDIFVNYPEPDASSCSRLFEKNYNLPKYSTLSLNGSVEGIYLIAQTFKNAKSLIFIPTFSEYEDAAKSFGHTITFKRNDKFEIDETYDIVFLCNPNNPDGKYFYPDEVEINLKRFKNTLFVIDEAYIRLFRGAISLVSLTTKYENLLVLNSFTKFYSIPGIRIGFLIGSYKTIDKIKAHKIPWSVNSVAINVARIILENHKELTPDLSDYFQECLRFKSELSKINGLKIYPSAMPFFLIKSEKFDAAYLKNLLAEKYKLLIRDASNFRGLSEYHFRVSTQTPEKNDMLENALREIYG